MNKRQKKKFDKKCLCTTSKNIPIKAILATVCEMNNIFGDESCSKHYPTKGVEVFVNSIDNEITNGMEGD